jgi:peptide/nickel transport system permease protein
MIRRLMRNPLGAASIALLLLVTLVAVIAPLLPLPDPLFVDLRSANLPPSGEHLLGTDSSGRDVMSRLVWGARVNLLGAALALAVAVAIGLPSGLLAGYYGKWFDGVSNWFTGLIMALPGIVVVLAARAVLGPSIWIAMTVFGIMLSPSIFRIVRGAVLSVRGELYVDAARVSGLTDARIMGRHILTVVRAPVIIQSARLASIAIAIQAGLEFLGVSDISVPSWGTMLNEGFRRIAISPELVLWPALTIGLVSMALILLGNALRDALEDTGGGARSEAVATSTAATAVPTTTAPAAPVEGALLSVRGLRVGYPAGDGYADVVHGVDLDIAEGEVLGLVGESGSGKTQTAFAVLGLLPEGGKVTGGSIRFDGVDLAGAGERTFEGLRGTQIAYIPQEPMSNLDPSFRIGWQLTAPLRHRLGLSKTAARDRALDLLDRVGIRDPRATFDAYPHQISGGMAQRVLIAGAVAGEPRLLIADEPTTALDVTVQAEVLDLLRDLQREQKMAVLLVTHNFGVVADLCDRVAVMSAGRVVETGEVDNVLRSPKDAYTKRLLGAMLEGGPTRDPKGGPR